MTFIYWEWHLIPRWLLSSIYARFPEQLLKVRVSLGSDGDCSMIDRFLGDTFGLLSCQFWSTVLQCGARLPIHLKPLNCVASESSFLTGCVFNCAIAHCRSVTVLFMLYKPDAPSLWCSTWAVYDCAGYTQCSGRTSVDSSLQKLAVPHRLYSSISVPLQRSCWLCIRWSGTAGFQEEGQCFLDGLSYSISFLSSTVFPFLFFLSIVYDCGAGVFGLIGWRSLSLSLALLASFNNNNNNWPLFATHGMLYYSYHWHQGKTIFQVYYWLLTTQSLNYPCQWHQDTFNSNNISSVLASHHA